MSCFTSSLVRLGVSPASIAWGTSAVVHTAGLVAAWLMVGQSGSLELPRLTGHAVAVELDAVWVVPPAEPLAEEMPPLDASVLIQPHQAQIVQQHFEPSETAMPPEPVELARIEQLLRELPSAKAERRPPRPAEELASAAIPRAQPLPRHLPAATVPPMATQVQPLGAGDQTAPRLLENRPPTYPAQAVVNRWEGITLLRIQVTAEGDVASVEVLSSSGFPVLDAAATRAVRTWRFEPARRSGTPITATIRLPVRFALE